VLAWKESVQEHKVVSFTCHRDQRAGFQKGSQTAEWRMWRYLPCTPHNLVSSFPCNKLAPCSQQISTYSGLQPDKLSHHVSIWCLILHEMIW